MRASVAVEKTGIPSVSVVCEGFELMGRLSGGGLGMPNLPMSVYPGHINFDSVEALQKKVESVLVDQIIQGLTQQPPEEATPTREPGLKDIVFKGTFEEVNQFFYEEEWGDGLPIVPPTAEKVEQFLEYTSHPIDQVIGTMLPDRREATVWNIAVNGVMAGCRPEYMPVLIAVVEAMADPMFHQESLGNTPGPEVLITINGPIIKDLGFNYEQGALRVGFQANTSIGRFWRLYLRNVAGFLPRKTDKATFGGTWRVVLAENEDAGAKIGWEPMSVDQGFKASDNVVTISACPSAHSVLAVGAATPEEILDKLAAHVVDTQLQFFRLCFRGPCARPQIVLSPCVAEAIAKGDYSKDKMKRYLYEHATFSAKRLEQFCPPGDSFSNAIRQGGLPRQYSESTDPDRLVPIVWSPDDFMIIVSGDPDRDNCFIFAQNGEIGYPVSRKIQLPANWEELLREHSLGRKATPC